MSTPANPPRAGIGALPVEVLDHIFSFTDPSDLSRILRASKFYCQVAAPALYHTVTVTSQMDLLFDTGLPADLLTRDTHIGSNAYPAAGRRTATDTATGAATLKRHFLSMIHRVEIVSGPSHEHTPFEFLLPPSSKRALARDRYARTLSRTAIGKWLATLPPPTIPCTHLIVHLDQNDFHRSSPLYPKPRATHAIPLYPFLEVIHPRRLVIRGVGFHQTSDPTEKLPSSIFTHAEEVVLIVTPGDVPEQSVIPDRYAMIGLPYVLDCIADRRMGLFTPNGHACFSRKTLVDFTVIISSPGPAGRFPPVETNPHMGLDTIHEGAETASGWLNPFTWILASELVSLRREHRRRNAATYVPTAPETVSGWTRSLGCVRLVNFGSLNGEDVGLPEATSKDMQDIIERSLRWHMSEAAETQSELADVKGDWLRFMGMKEWLGKEEGKGERAVLSADTMRGWE